MLTLKENSKLENNLLYATCNFDTTFTQDWLLLNMRVTDTEYNIFYNTFFEWKCLSAISANIRGYSCNNDDVAMWQSSNGWALHVDSSASGCGCNSWVHDATSTEDNFGYHDGTINTAFTCTASSSSTTNWWIGARVSPTSQPTSAPLVVYDDDTLQYIGVYAPEGINWIDSLLYCENNFGTSLASIHSSDDQTEASNAAYGATPDEEETTHVYGWIGLNDYFDNDGSWSWSDGTSFDYAYWASGEPNNDNEDCAQIAGLTQTRYPLVNGINGPWNDETCTTTLAAFVCNRRVPTPTSIPTSKPTSVPTRIPTRIPTNIPTTIPTNNPTDIPTRIPTKIPSVVPTNNPTSSPTGICSNLCL